MRSSIIITISHLYTYIKYDRKRLPMLTFALAAFPIELPVGPPDPYTVGALDISPDVLITLNFILINVN